MFQGHHERKDANQILHRHAGWPGAWKPGIGPRDWNGAAKKRSNSSPGYGNRQSQYDAGRKLKATSNAT